MLVPWVVNTLCLFAEDLGDICWNSEPDPQGTGIPGGRNWEGGGYILCHTCIPGSWLWALLVSSLSPSSSSPFSSFLGAVIRHLRSRQFPKHSDLPQEPRAWVREMRVSGRRSWDFGQGTTLDKLLPHSMPQFSHLGNEGSDSIIFLIALLQN